MWPAIQNFLRWLEGYGVGHLVRMVLGWVFITLGLAGLVLPVLQGILFLVIGAVLLSPYHRFFRRLKLMFYRRFPRIRWKVEDWKRRIKARYP